MNGQRILLVAILALVAIVAVAIGAELLPQQCDSHSSELTILQPFQSTITMEDNDVVNLKNGTNEMLGYERVHNVLSATSGLLVSGEEAVVTCGGKELKVYPTAGF